MPVLVKDTYALFENSYWPWLVFIDEILHNAGYSCVWDLGTEYVDFTPELKQRLTDQYK